MRIASASSLIVILAAAGTTAAAEEVQRSHRFDTTGIEHLHIDHRGGELILEPAPGDQIEVELRIEPQDEREVDVAELDVTSSVGGDRLTLRFGEVDVHSHMLGRVPRVQQVA